MYALRYEVAACNCSADSLASRRTIESERRPGQKPYRGNFWSGRRCSESETWRERRANDLKTTAGAAVSIAVRGTILTGGAES
jgi:hypothetical protein